MNNRRYNMKNYNKTVRLKSDEYKSASTMRAFSGTWIPWC